MGVSCRNSSVSIRHIDFSSFYIAARWRRIKYAVSCVVMYVSIWERRMAYW